MSTEAGLMEGRFAGGRWAYGGCVLIVLVCLGLAVPSVLRAASSSREASAALTAQRMSRLAGASAFLLRAVQDERGIGSEYLNGVRPSTEVSLQKARLATDAAVRSWNGAALALPPESRDVLAGARQSLVGLANERRGISAREGRADEHFAWYTDLASAVITVAAKAANQVEEVGGGSATRYVSLLVGTEYLARERGQIAGILEAGTTASRAEIREIGANRAARAAAFELFALLSAPAEVRALAALSGRPQARFVDAVEKDVIEDDASPVVVDADTWFRQVSALLDQHYAVIEAQNAHVQTGIDEIVARANQDVRDETAVAVAILALGLLLGVGLPAAARHRIRAGFRKSARHRQAQAAGIEAILSTASDAILTIDERGVIERANAATEQVFGYSPGELVGQNVSVLMTTEAASQYTGNLDEYFESRGEHFTGAPREALGKRKDGSEIPLEVLITRARIGERSMFTSFIRDISERKHALETLTRRDLELSARNEALARSNAELQQFAYVASHDLQEPLRKVTSYVEVLEADYGDRLDDQAREYMHFAADAAHRMRQLINDLLALSRIREETMRVDGCDTRAVVDAIIDDFEVVLDESGATVGVGDLPVLPGDRAHLHQVFQNLISNAVKYRGERPLRIDITAQFEPEGWHFVVRDNGVGFRQEYAEKIFGMFTRLVSRREYEGTGIGLAIVAKIIINHGGRIWATSAPGVGTTIEFILPVDKARYPIRAGIPAQLTPASEEAAVR